MLGNKQGLRKSKGITGLIQNSEIQKKNIYGFNACVLQLFLTCCSPHEHCADRTHLHPWTEPQGSQLSNCNIYSNNIYHRGMKMALWTANLTLHPHHCDTESPAAHSLGLKEAVEKPEPMALQQPAATAKKTKMTEKGHVVKEFTPELQCRNALDFLLQHKTYYFVQVSREQ